MRCLHVSNHMIRLNGHVHAAVDLACAQADLGHQVAVLSGTNDFGETLQEHGVKSIVLPRLANGSRALLSLAAIDKAVRDWRPDVIHAHMTSIALTIWPIAKLRGVPLVATVHNSFRRSSALMRCAHRVVVVSDAVRETMIGFGVPAEKLRVVLNGVLGSARFSQELPEPLPFARPSVVFVGGLHPRKGVADLIRAFESVNRAFPNASLYIGGEGPCEGEYRALAEASSAAHRITFIGPLKDPRAAMRAADIFVLPSISDPAPLAMSEARVAGCAIVASAVDGIPELLDHGAAGLLVPPANPERLASAIVSLLSSPADIAALRSRATEGLDRFTVARVAKETLAVYEELPRPRGTAAETSASGPYGSVRGGAK